MSRKVIPFTQLPRGAAQARAAGEGPESWINADGEVPGTGTSSAAIDLMARRSWPELMVLIAMFPWLATSLWMAEMMRAMSGTRGRE